VALSKLLAALIAAQLAAFGSCFTELRALHAPFWIAPAPKQLSQIGDVAAVLALPPRYVPGSLVATLDGQDVSSAFSAGSDLAQGTLHVAASGPHSLHATVHLTRFGVDTSRDADVSFTTVDLPNADQCEVLNAIDCLLPYPSSRFLAPANTPTGFRLELPQGLTPSIFSLDQHKVAPLDPAPYRALDGFSPAVQVLMHFPGNVDPEQSKASRLVPETRSYDLTSLRPDSPTLLIEADTGEQVLHFIEVDARDVDPSSGAPNPSQLVFLRPAEHLKHGKRYIVAVRHLVHPDGTPVVAEPAFAALRDGTPTTIPAIEARRAQFAKIFADLRRAGLRRQDLSQLALAFDFTVASQQNTTGEMLSMRDQSFAWLASQTAPTFSVDSTRSQ
jgi:hypothetical protein